MQKEKEVIRRSIGALVMLTLMVCMASVVFARGGSPGKKAFTSNAAVEKVSPVVAPVPVMTGYDVIQNISEDSNTLIAVSDSAYTAKRLSATGDWRSNHYAMSASQTSRSAPNKLRMLR